LEILVRPKGANFNKKRIETKPEFQKSYVKIVNKSLKY